MKYLLCLLLIVPSLQTLAQQHVKVNVTDGKSNTPLELVTVSSNNQYIATTDSAGNADITEPAGILPLHFSLTGYNPVDTTINNGTGQLNITMLPNEQNLEEVVIVASTRNGQAIENSPQKVEVLGREEMNEEASLKPGNIASILGDVSGVQVQQSSATSGNSNVRIQGLSGKYTQILRDGMPLYNGFSGGFGILTIPPLDLQQIELIKGSASTLYGGGAIGGLINLISKRPTYNQEVDALVNYTTLSEFNTNAYAAKRNNKWGYTLFAGYTYQSAKDVDKDGFSDVPHINSMVVHPKLFYYPSDKTIISIGYEGAFDNRKGGDINVLNDKADATHQYFENNNSQRHTGQYLLEHYFIGNTKLTIKGVASSFDNETTTNRYNTVGKQTSFYNEAFVLVPFGKSNLAGGINVTGDNYKTFKPDSALLKRFSNLTYGVFAQYALSIKDNTNIEAGLRADWHTTYGAFLLPRIAGIHHFNKHWGIRAGFGMGYKTPNPLEPQNFDYSILDVLPINSNVKPEKSYGYNAEVNYKYEWNKNSSIFINQAFFLTQVNKPILFQYNSYGQIDLMNAGSPITTKGSDTYVKLTLTNWELYLGYTYTDAQNTYLPANTFVPLTPRNRWAFVIVKEFNEKLKAGLEGSYVGQQYRYDFTKTPSYMLLAAMIQYNLAKHFSIVLNGENLLDYRMSRYETLYTGPVTDPAFKPLWAPIDGRVINLSLRWKL